MPTNNKKNAVLMIMSGVTMLLVSALLLVPATPVSAQCGSQASSCKNCHEVQGELPVNNDGTQWHQPHAFGDFCEFCHAGNVQSTDKGEAHTGMVAPLSDPKASCSVCHDNYMDLAQEYAGILGVEIGANTSSTGSNTGNTESSQVTTDNSAPAQTVALDNTAIAIDDESILDFNRQYEESVFGIRDLNIGNVILGGLILLMLGGGGLFVSLNEKWISITPGSVPTTIEGHPRDAVALLPDIEKMNDPARKALKKLLEKPDKAAKIFLALTDLEDKNEGDDTRS